jgi:hypothetical protein
MVSAEISNTTCNIDAVNTLIPTPVQVLVGSAHEQVWDGPNIFENDCK